MPRWPAVLALALGAGALAPAAAGCNSDAVGVDACKSIEEARCRRLPDCPDLQVSPAVQYTSGSATDACIRYYDTACGHGLAVGDPGAQKVDDCVAAINAGSCDVVAAPDQNAPACAWLAPADAGGEAAAADAGDAAAADAADGATE